MKMKSLSALSIIAALFGATSAPVSAADMRAPVKAPVVAPAPYVHNWTGFYIGGHIGGAWSDRCATFEFGVGEVCNDANGWLGGGQVGFNFQTGQFVFGVEFSGSFADIATDQATGTLPGGWWFQSEGKTLLLLTGRIGYAFDRALIYVTGGGAWARNSVDFFDGAFVTTVDFDRQGWTIGGGFEYAFTPNWSLAAQYNYVDLGSKSIYFPTVDLFANVEQEVHIATLRLNYRFGGWGAPVAARY
jgi:outer membrane immunogenic protein